MSLNVMETRGVLDFQYTWEPGIFKYEGRQYKFEIFNRGADGNQRIFVPFTSFPSWENVALKARELIHIILKTDYEIRQSRKEIENITIRYNRFDEDHQGMTFNDEQLFTHTDPRPIFDANIDLKDCINKNFPRIENFEAVFSPLTKKCAVM